MVLREIVCEDVKWRHSREFSLIFFFVYKNRDIEMSMKEAIETM